MSATYEIKPLPHSQCQIVMVGIAQDLLDRAEKKALAEFNQTLKLPGFRPGHIPEAKVREMVSEGAVRLRTIEMAFPEEAQRILSQEKIKIIGSPKTSFESLEPLKIVMTFDVLPEVKLGEYEKIKVDVKPKGIEKREVDDAIQHLCERFSEHKTVDRTAQKGDRVEVDFDGFTSDGVPLENSSSKNHPLVLGDGMMIPGFEEQLMGLKAGETKEFEISFPKDYHVKRLADRPVKFKVTMRLVQEVIPSKVDENFIEKVLGKKMSEEEFRAEVEGQLKMQADKTYRADYQDQFFAKLVQVCTVDPPQSLVDSEKENILKELKERILYSGGSYDSYLQHAKMTEDQLKESYSAQARERVSLHLILQEIAKEKNIEVDELSIEEEINRLTVSVPEDRKAMIRKQYSKGSSGYAVLKYQLRLRRVLDLLLPFSTEL